MKKLYYWFLPIILLMLIGTFFDLQISIWQDTVADNIIIHSYYRFFEIFGEFAFMFIFALVFGLFANFGYRKEGVIKWVQMLLNGFGLIAFSIMEFISFARYLAPTDGNSHGEITQPMIVISIVLGLVLAIIIFKLMFNIKDEDYSYYRKIAIVSIVYVVILTITVNTVKVIWARPRYWMVAGGQATFVPWYIINGNQITDVTNAYMSFPSGHTANAFASLAIMLWFPKRKELFLNIFMTWGLLTAISRIFAGQHYLTDTVMGAVIAVTIFTLLLKLFKININQ